MPPSLDSMAEIMADALVGGGNISPKLRKALSDALIYKKPEKPATDKPTSKQEGSCSGCQAYKKAAEISVKTGIGSCVIDSRLGVPLMVAAHCRSYDVVIQVSGRDSKIRDWLKQPAAHWQNLGEALRSQYDLIPKIPPLDNHPKT